LNELNVGCCRGECFGLLGVNGAGKTSTFKMLTGDETISSGEAWVEGLSVKTDMNKVHQRIGYCPQFDALLDDLTGRETLRIFALLRGIPRQDINKISMQLADDLNFTKHLDKRIKAYSGGNKRKLSTALVSFIWETKISGKKLFHYLSVVDRRSICDLSRRAHKRNGRWSTSSTLEHGHQGQKYRQISGAHFTQYGRVRSFVHSIGESFVLNRFDLIFIF
jgi:ABC-type glutathione transport system ATPase component